MNLSLELPKNLIINSAGSHLYKIGLSLFPFGSQRRYKYHNPLFIFVLNTTLIIKWIISSLITDDQYDIHLLIGDYFYFMDVNARHHLNLAAIFYGLTSLVSYVLHFYYYKRDIKPTYLRPFEMMAGMVSPQDIGLKDGKCIIELLNRSRSLFRFSKILSKLFAMCSVIFTSEILFSQQSIFQLLFLSIPWQILLGMFVYFAANDIIYQIVYFYIICQYLKIKIKSFNKSLLNVINSKKRCNIKYMIQTLHEILSEIMEFNNNFWSMFLSLFTVIIITVTNMILYFVLFSKTILIYKIGLFLQFIELKLVFFVLLLSSSSVYSENFKTYKVLNKLYIHQINVKMRVSLRFKVTIYCL